MLPVKYRIKKELLPLVLKQNRVFSSSNFSLRLHNRFEAEPNWGKQSRLAVIISNKIAPLSTRRHLIKRQIHAVLEKVWSATANNLDIIIQVKGDVLKLDFPDPDKELLDLLRTAKVLK